MTNQSTLLFSTFFALISGGIYAYVGWRLGKRVISSSDGRLAWGAFTLWWYGLAVTTLIGSFQNLFGAMGLTNLSLFVTATYVNIFPACIALWGLLYYLIYIFTGNKRSLIPLTVFYIIYYILLVYYTTASIPDHIEVGRWSTTLIYSTPLRGPFFVILAVLLFFPQIIGSIAYFTLYFRVTDATQKYRILLVSGSMMVWLISPYIALVGGVSQNDVWHLASRFLGLAAPFTILMAYLPPNWLKERYSIISLNDENSES